MAFAFEERASDSALVETIYRTETSSVESFVSVATAQWALVVTSGHHGIRMTLKVIDAALRDVPMPLTSRSVQRRFRSVTGLSQNRIRQILRAQEAARLLERGTSITAVAHDSGCADQAHLTKALGLLLGQTPAQIVKSPKATSLY